MVQDAVAHELDVSAKGDCDSLWVLTFRKKINLLLLVRNMFHSSRKDNTRAIDHMT